MKNTIKSTGFEILQNMFDPVEATRFIQFFENGYGDYTKEKYDRPDLTLEELNILLKNKQNIKSE
jgi:hypothetical protein